MSTTSEDIDIDIDALLAMPVASGSTPLVCGVRCEPEDFRVDELIDVEFTGTGEHLWLQVRKTNRNTDDVVRSLARHFDVRRVDIGYAGLKDRRAITTQWFSIRTADSAGSQLFAEGADAGAMQVCQQTRHGRKLRTGAHRGNRFVLLLRDVLEPAVLESRLQSLADNGFPNYFGLQRFGRGGGNLPAAAALFAPGKRRRVDRHKRGLYLSAARSAVFNRVCAERVLAGSWQQALPGEPLMLSGSQSWFLASDDASSEQADPIAQRLATGDVSPSGPMWGRGETLATGQCRAFEQAVLDGFTNYCEGLAAAGLEQARRPLRARATDLSWQRVDAQHLELTFCLEKGVFATSLLAELGITEGRHS